MDILVPCKVATMELTNFIVGVDSCPYVRYKPNGVTFPLLLHASVCVWRVGLYWCPFIMVSFRISVVVFGFTVVAAALRCMRAV